MQRITLLKRWMSGCVCLLAAFVGGCQIAEPKSKLTEGSAGQLVSVHPAGRTDSEVAAYNIHYWTNSALSDMKPVLASALLLVPDVITSNALTSYQHSTSVARNDAPTISGTAHWVAAHTLAKTGRIVVAADYLGFGIDQGPHPWLDAATEASTIRDLLDAVPAALSKLALPQVEVLDLVGFSQGAHATFALASTLHDQPIPSMRLRTVIGIGGPYALSEIDIPAVVNGTSNPAIRSLVLSRIVLSAYLRGFQVDYMYSNGWQARIQELFDGTQTSEEVIAALPADPSEMFTEQGWTDITNPDSQFGKWLAATSDICSVDVADVQVHLMHASGDTHALPENSRLCHARLQNAGTVVSLTDLGDIEHIPSGTAGVQLAAEILSAADEQPTG